jgi:4-hydroxybenzoate polyprenyltransferase
LAFNTNIKQYASLVKFGHTVFALPFALCGFAFAVAQPEYTFSWPTLFLVILCMVTARNSAMAFNRWLDAKYDALNERTAVREIPSGVIQSKQALIFVIINSVLFIVGAYFINKLCFMLSPIALFVILFYSFTKRFTSLCHLVLGIGLALAPVGAYLSLSAAFNSIVPILLGFSVLTWVSGFDIIYALQDEEFDRSQDLHSIPVVLGTKGALIFSTLLHIITACIISYIGYIAQLGSVYWLGATLFIGLLIYQHTIVKPNDLSKVNLAFFTTNGVGSLVFMICFITAILIKHYA